MKQLFLLLLLAIGMSAAAQSLPDSTDIFFRHLELKEVTVTGAVGDMKMKESSMPITIISPVELRHKSGTNIIDAIARQPGLAEITTGGGISKPVIRGLGYNRIIVVNDGIRQEGQQWGDEHGIEVDGNDINRVEVIKGPASLMYGSDALAGVLIFHNTPIPPLGKIRGGLNTEYQTNNGLAAYSLDLAGHHNNGFVWDVRYSDKYAHAYKNSHDGYVPNSQFSERAFYLKAGVMKRWGMSTIKAGYYNLIPSIVEGERDSITGELISYNNNVKTYGHGLPYQRVTHYKIVSNTIVNLPSGNLKVLLGYQQNRRQEFEESPDTCGLYMQLHTINYDVRYVTEEFAGWKLSTGFNGMVQRSLNLGDESLIPDYGLFDIGAYVTAIKTLNRWSISGGVRYDHRYLVSDFTRYFNGVTGSVGATFEASDHLDLKLNLSRGFRAPNISELAADGEHEGTLRYEIGNKDFDPEYSMQADLGFDITTRYLELHGALFANHIDNYIYLHRIDSIIEPDLMTFVYAQGNAMLLGFEAGIDVHPIHALHLGCDFSYVDAQLLNQPDDMKYLPQTPAPRLSADVKYELTHDGKVFDNAFIAARLDWYLEQDHYYAAYETETMTPSYTLFGLSIGTDVLRHGKKVAELMMIADNLFDVSYQDHLSRLKYAGIYNMGRNIVFKMMIPINGNL